MSIDEDKEGNLEDPELSGGEEDVEEELEDAEEDVDEDESGMTYSDAFNFPGEVLTITDPFDTHFTNPEAHGLSQKVQALSQNKWRSSKKELSDGLRLVSSYPSVDGDDIPALSAVQGPKNLKVSSLLRTYKWLC